jgi:hypothetical protein
VAEVDQASRARSACEFRGRLTDEARTRIARALVGIGADLTSLEATGGRAYRVTFDLPEDADREQHLRAVVELQEAVDGLGHDFCSWEPPR